MSCVCPSLVLVCKSSQVKFRLLHEILEIGEALADTAAAETDYITKCLGVRKSEFQYQEI